MSDIKMADPLATGQTQATTTYKPLLHKQPAYIVKESSPEFYGKPAPIMYPTMEQRLEGR